MQVINDHMYVGSLPVLKPYLIFYNISKLQLFPNHFFFRTVSTATAQSESIK